MNSISKESMNKSLSKQVPTVSKIKMAKQLSGEQSAKDKSPQSNENNDQVTI